MTLKILTSILLITLPMMGPEPASGPEIFLPAKIQGWQPEEDDRKFYPETLFDHINGGAELYLSYGFREVVSRRYEKQDQPFIQAEIFDMTEARNAYGIYTQTREKDDFSYGQGAQVLQGAILFWKGPYYVSLVSEYETPESNQALAELAASIDANISATGEIPGVVRSMPSNGLNEGSILYFRHYIWANQYFYIGDGNIFGIEEDTDCCLARYGQAPNSFYLLVMDFPAPGRAAAAFEGYWEERFGEQQPVLEEEEGRWHAGRTEGNRVAMVFRAPDSAAAVKLLEKVYQKP